LRPLAPETLQGCLACSPMSLFQTLLHVRKIRDAAMEGHGFIGIITMDDVWDMLPWKSARQNSRRATPTTTAQDKSCPVLPENWTVVDESVIDLDRLAACHPGGSAILKVVEGHDATVLFHSVHALSNSRSVTKLLQRVSIAPIQEFPELGSLKDADSVFDWGTHLSPLATDLQTQVLAYFGSLAKSSGLSMQQVTKATSMKMSLVSVLWTCYAASLIAWLCGSWAGLLLSPILGALATFHTFHDASHGALSSKAWVNELLNFTGFLIAAPHEWRWQHIAGHHAFTNITDLDPDSKHANRWVAAEKPRRPPAIAALAVWTIAVPLGLQTLGSWRYLASRATGLTHHHGSRGMPPPASHASILAMVLHRLVF